MRTPIGYAILLAACLSGAQTSQEFHSRYGDSDTERFKIRDGIGLTVEYGSDGSACQMEIKAQQHLVQRPPEKLMAPEVVDGIIDEVVPPDTRGRKVDRSLERMGCAQHVVDYYENVKIGRSTDQCLPLKPERDTSVNIVFKRQACPDNWLARCGAGCCPLPEGTSRGERKPMQRCANDVPKPYKHLPKFGIRYQSENDPEKAPNLRLCVW